eukprot:TRINITY_DN11915_c0_g2_i1.p4 TRINITY_DN11915_c0_g2~~TRINITY_DN11915_c0_g2_i1.p4  ORF type:complete len:163 (+),score=10.66 TRINITY_DN11915_c0_g2_i1:2388-2876(+)
MFDRSQRLPVHHVIDRGRYAVMSWDRATLKGMIQQRRGLAPGACAGSLSILGRYRSKAGLKILTFAVFSKQTPRLELAAQWSNKVVPLPHCSDLTGETPLQRRFKKFWRELNVLPDFADCCFHNSNGAKIATGDFDKLGPKPLLPLPFVEGFHYCNGITEGA